MRWAETDPELAQLADQWADEIKPGDVVRTKSGDLRIVRQVERNDMRHSGRGAWGVTKARRTFAYFAIKRCSWTHRPYTVYSVGEMVTMGWTPSAAKPRVLSTELDQKLQRDFGAYKCALTCCAVRGIP